MKKLKTLLLIAVLAIGFVGCKKDEPTINSTIVGSWQLKKTIDKRFENGLITRDTIYTADNAYVEFKSNGTGTFNELEEGKVVDTDVFTYTLIEDGKKVSFKYSDGDIETELIKELTNTKLILYSEDTEVRNNITYKYIYEEIYERK